MSPGFFSLTFTFWLAYSEGLGEQRVSEGMVLMDAIADEENQ